MRQSCQFALSNTDMFGAGKTLLYTVIPGFHLKKFAILLSSLTAGNVLDFLEAVRASIPPGTLNTFINNEKSNEMLELIFKLFKLVSVLNCRSAVFFLHRGVDICGSS